MKGFFAIFRRELVMRRMVLVMAALLGLLPLLAPLLPSMAAHRPDAARQGALLVIVSAVLFCGPITLGASLFSRDLAEGRLAFEFSRPISAAELWFGKLAAALVSLVGSLGLVTLPSVLVEPELLSHARVQDWPPQPLLGYPETLGVQLLPPQAMPASSFLMLLFSVLVTVMLAAHVASTLLRLRSAWLLLDVAALAVVIGLVFLVRELLVSRQAFGPLRLFETGALAGFILVLSAAGCLQLALTRTDAQGSRRVLQAVVWPGMAGVLLLGLTWSWWAIHPSWSAVKKIEAVHVSPGGQHALIRGELSGRGGHQSSFLAALPPDSPSKTEDGPGAVGSSSELETVRLNTVTLRSRPTMRFSKDGSRLYWLTCRRVVRPDCEIMTRDLRAGTESRATGIEFDHWYRARFDLTPSGNLLALTGWDRVSVFEGGSGRLVGALDRRGLADARFLSPDRLLLVVDREGKTRFELWDLEERSTRLLTEQPGAWSSRLQYLDLPRSRVLYSAVLPPTHRVVDLESGEVLADLEPLISEHGLLRRAFWLDDGRLLLIVTPTLAPDELESFTALVLDPLNLELEPQSVELGFAKGVEIGPRLASGQVLITLRESQAAASSPGRGVDLAALGVSPLERWSTWRLDMPTDGQPAVGLLADGLRPTASPEIFEASGGALLRWHATSGDAMELVVTPP